LRLSLAGKYKIYNGYKNYKSYSFFH